MQRIVAHQRGGAEHPLRFPARYVHARLFDWPDTALAGNTLTTPPGPARGPVCGPLPARWIARPRRSAANGPAIARRVGATPARPPMAWRVPGGPPPGRLASSVSTACPGVWYAPCWTGKGRRSRLPLPSNASTPTSRNATCRTKPSTRRSTPSRAGSCAAS